MSGEQLETQATISEDQEQTIQDTEPVEQTTQDNEPVKLEETVSEEGEKKTDAEDPRDKALRDTKATLTKLQQERAEERKQQKEQESKQQKNSLDSATSQLEKDYNVACKNIIEIKAQALKNEAASLKTQGYTPDQIIDYISERSKQLDNFADEEKQKLTSKFEADKSKVSNDLNDYVSRQFKDVEDNFKEDLENPAIKHAYDEYKSKYHNAKEFTEFVLPLIKKALEINNESLSKTKQINAGIDKTKQSQKGASGTSSKTGSGSGVQSILEDDKKLAALLKY